ncbi:hypothetical protein FI667_g11828, partial [Globisporangium splendens]
MALLDRISKLWNAFARQWNKFHVERHGSYSIERLYNFKRYCECASWVRVVLVLVMTPLPCLVVTTTTDLIPLEPTEKGLGHSYRFWIRTGCVGCELGGDYDWAFRCDWVVSLAILPNTLHTWVAGESGDWYLHGVGQILSWEPVRSASVYQVHTRRVGASLNIVLTVIDFLFAIKSLVDIWASIQDAERIILSQSRGSTEGTDAIAAPTQPRNLKLQLPEVTIHLVETYPALLKHDSIRVRSQALQKHLQSRIYPNALSRPLESAGRARASARKPGDANRISPRLSSKKQIETQQPEPTSSVISHLQPQLRRVGSSWMAETESNLISSNLMQEGKQTVAALSDAQRLKFAQEMLRTLYWTEFVLLVEFTGAVIPIIYCAYLGVAFRLPNRVHYSQLRGIDETTLNANIETVLVYAALQALSLMLMIVLLHFKLRISVVRQLTFVSKSQWQQVQAKLVLWLVFSVQATLDHFGEDFSFQFAWLHKSQTPV